MNELNFNEPTVQIDLPDLFGTEKTKENVTLLNDYLQGVQQATKNDKHTPPPLTKKIEQTGALIKSLK